MSLKRVIINGKETEYVDIPTNELTELAEQQALQEYEQSLQPSHDELEQAKFELKTITLLYELGVI